MKACLLIPAGFLILLTALTSCTSLSPQDRALLVETRHANERARDEAALAVKNASVVARSTSDSPDRLYQLDQSQ